MFICHQTISGHTAFVLNKVLRKLQHIKHLDVFLESGGGDIDSAYKILHLFKAYAEKITVIVPFYAKSAASLIALGADELLVCKAGELGPIDPQVRDPQTNLFVPAHSIKETMSFIDEVSDPIVKLSLTDKIPALLVGSYRASGKSSKQYLDEIFTEKGIADKATAISVFTERFLSHGYPMHRKFLLQNKIPLGPHDQEFEDKICDLHEIYVDFCAQAYGKNPEQNGEMLIVQSDEYDFAMLGEEILKDGRRF